MGLFCSIPAFVSAEEKTWIDHTLVFDEPVRLSNLEQLNLFKDGSKIYLAKLKSTWNSVTFQHWFVTDRTNFFEFGAPDINIYTARVVIFSGARTDYNCDPDDKIFCTVMNKEIRDRMHQIMGMSNYSLCMRNCEHVANFAFRGRWISGQMQSDGVLMSRFRRYMLGDTERMVNTFPSVLRELTKDLAKPVYSFTEGHYTFTRLDYFLDYDEDTYNILVVGPTGSGKSNFINVLFNQEICYSAISLKSVTRDICFVRGRGPVYNPTQNEFVERNLVVADTVGFCDTEWKDDEILALIRHRVSVNFKHIDEVYVVFRADRLIPRFVENVNKILDWLGYHDGTKRLRFVFIGTHGELFDDKKKDAMRIVARKTFKLQDAKRMMRDGKDCELLIYTGFAPEKGLNAYTKRKVKEDWEQLRQVAERPGDAPRLSVRRGKSCTIL